jgi:NADH dehydrogenase FAD-containing subunit
MLTITIIEALPTILSGWDERLVEKVNEVLLKKRNKNKNKLCSYQG